MSNTKAAAAYAVKEGEFNTMELADIEKTLSKTKTGNLLKFIICSLVGIANFLVPFKINGEFTTLNTVITNWLKNIMIINGVDIKPYAVVACLAIAVIMPMYYMITKAKWIENSNIFSKVFITKPVYFITRVVGLAVAVMVLFQIGPEFIISGATGGTMLDLSATLFAITFAMSFFLPFLTDCGLMEFMGILLNKVTKPLFKVPGRSSVDLVTSWFGASNAAVILTREQYNKGYYTKREAGTIMTNFSLVSIPFCLLIATMLDIPHLFPAFYLTICIVGIILAILLCRIPPLSKLPDEYNEETGKQINETVPENVGKFKWAVALSCERAETFTAKHVITGGFQVIASLLIDLIPIVMAWGTLGLILAEFTPLFTWISYPMGWFMQLLGIEGAMAAAPATLIGFIDMFIPAILIAGDFAVKTKFIIGVLSLVQIIYMTEVGAIIVKSNIKVGFGKLFLIFMERTLIALPLITFFAFLFL